MRGPRKSPKLDDVLRDLMRCLTRLERETGGTFTFSLEWQPREQPVQKRSGGNKPASLSEDENGRG